MVYQHLEYFAYGETFVEEHSNTHRTPFLFNGKELDDETGLYYYGARYYDPRSSVWLSVDALSEHENQVDKSPYIYGWSNPVKYVDPDGNCPDCPTEYQPIAEDQLISYLALHTWASIKNVSSVSAGALLSGGNTFLLRRQYTVAADKNGQVFLHESDIYAESKGQSAISVLIDALSIYPGGKGGGLMAKTGSKAAFSSIAKSSINSIGDIIKSASRIQKGKTSRGVQALSKKIGRGDEPYRGLKATQENVTSIIENVMNANNKVIKPGRNQQGKEIIDFFNPDSRQGIRLIKETGEFDTLVNF
ncbi:RHS repeat-associated core domain-containing protein [Persicobacter diffluens]|uniref:RHS repeat-associated core domain-containing protein n=1 Tax=Persicobacter diffluens TaxID=981 RepID=A0AAN5AN10_9BACT|nr:hypothetical protein PEDI_55710 [Persicobacter diffluens]